MESPDFIPQRGQLSLPVPEDSVFDEPMRCLHINAEWLTYLAGMVFQLGDFSLYEQETEEEKTHIYRNVQTLLAQIGEAEECPEPVTYQIQVIQYLHLENVGVNGGTTTANAWTALPINHKLRDDTGLTSVSGNVISGIPNDDWNVDAEHVIRTDAAAWSQIRLAAALAYRGVQQRVLTDEKLISFKGVYPVSSGTLSWSYYVSDALVNTGLGQAKSLGTDGEVYGKITMWRLFQTS